jgi:hypothetical protein
MATTGKQLPPSSAGEADREAEWKKALNARSKRRKRAAESGPQGDARRAQHSAAMAHSRNESFSHDARSLITELSDTANIARARQQPQAAATRVNAVLTAAQRLMRAQRYTDAMSLLSHALLGYEGVWRDLRPDDAVYDGPVDNSNSPIPPHTLNAIVLLAEASERAQQDAYAAHWWNVAGDIKREACAHKTIPDVQTLACWIWCAKLELPSSDSIDMLTLLMDEYLGRLSRRKRKVKELHELCARLVLEGYEASERHADAKQFILRRGLHKKYDDLLDCDDEPLDLTPATQAHISELKEIARARACDCGTYTKAFAAGEVKRAPAFGDDASDQDDASDLDLPPLHAVERNPQRPREPAPNDAESVAAIVDRLSQPDGNYNPSVWASNYAAGICNHDHALRTLSRVPASLLTTHESAIVNIARAKLKDASDEVRIEGLRALAALPQDLLLQYADLVEAALRDPDEWVIDGAIDTLCRLDVAALGARADAIVRTLKYELTDPDTVMRALHKMSPSTPLSSRSIKRLCPFATSEQLPDWVRRKLPSQVQPTASVRDPTLPAPCRGVRANERQSS